MKIYRTIFMSNDIDEGDNTINVTTFLNKENAIKYYKEQLECLKKEQEELDMEDYEVVENETSYERYLDGRAVEQSVSLWIEEDDTYDELILQTEKNMNNEESKEYEV